MVLCESFVSVTERAEVVPELDGDFGMLDAHATIGGLSDLCLSVFPWAHFRSTKAAVKMHTLLDLRGCIPSFMHISEGKLHDVNVLDAAARTRRHLCHGPRYLDFARLYLLHQAGAFFVTRAKTNIDTRRLYSAPSDRANGIICDQTIVLAGIQTSQREAPRHRGDVLF